MEAKKFLSLLGWVMLGAWLIHFFIYYLIDLDRGIYSVEKIVSGIVFILIAVPIYFTGVHLYYKFSEERS
ncbi:hypothetical protein [Anaerobacillus sp. 1_MG-2023]|uniref:hypothetical protein n=1 Tax=Anaerobacillus sp. 1_MG-2023 TaxID=3062655 RepID=UPI0026E28D9C|nr:hypothetical protein [Anaerobacillus sp. 1_MG-2023]MDO6654373.1 hypothetical protein [Anaerobacillus sp. 1_MG-2023]